MPEDAIPTTPFELPVFPLTGTLLLPGTFLPLNIFEKRYLSLVEDALAGDGRIGLIQPERAALDNWGLVDPEEKPDLTAVGCWGEIERWQQEDDGRYNIVLSGRCRFRILQELPRRRGYRRVVADASPFAGDVTEDAESLDPSRLLAAVSAVQERGEIEFDMDVLAALPGVILLNALCVALPFEPVEKQALLEAPDSHDREETLLRLLGMGFDPSILSASPPPPPMVN